LNDIDGGWPQYAKENLQSNATGELSVFVLFQYHNPKYHI